MTDAPPGPTVTDAGTIDALKRIKAAEAEWGEKVERARRESEAVLGRLRGESDASVAAARASAEAERAGALQKARTVAEEEAGRILSEGRAAAEGAASVAGKRPIDRKEDLLQVVLGSFGHE